MKNIEYKMIREQFDEKARKICIITDQFPPYPQDILVLRGGVDIGLKQLSDEFRKYGYSTVIITQHYMKKLKIIDEPYIKRIRIYIPYSLNKKILNNSVNFLINETFNPFTFWKIYKTLKKEDPDLVLLGATHQLSLAPMIATLSLKIPLYNRYDWPCPVFPSTKPCYFLDRIFGCGSCIEKYTNIKIGRVQKLALGLLTACIYKIKIQIWKKCNRIFPVNEFYSNLYSALGVPKDKIHVIPTYREIEKVPITTKKFIQIRKQAKFIFLYVGRLNPEKGIMLLLDSYKEVGEKIKDIHLIIAGDGLLREEVKEISSKNEKITFLGWQTKEQLSQLYQISDAVIIPSIVPEGDPRAAEEAMIFDKIIIGFDIGGLHEIFEKYPKNVRIRELNKKGIINAISNCAKSGTINYGETDELA